MPLPILKACALCLLILLAGCRGQTSHPSDEDRGTNPADDIQSTYDGAGPIQAVCTTGMVADLVRQVGGERVAVHQLLGPGTDPHLYKASPGDVARLSGADIVFYNGLHLEGKMGDVLRSMRRRTPTIPVAEYLPHERLLDADDGVPDPHVWFDVELWSHTVDVVRDALCAFDPPHAEQYTARAADYRAQLVALHEDARTRLASVPEPQRVLVTAHDAFRYFGRAYDVEVLGIQGISTESEAGVHEINQLVSRIVQGGIHAVFVESTVSDRNMQALVEGCASRGHSVAIGGELYSDAMGAEGSDAETYTGMVRHNVATIVEALR